VDVLVTAGLLLLVTMTVTLLVGYTVCTVARPTCRCASNSWIVVVSDNDSDIAGWEDGCGGREGRSQKVAETCTFLTQLIL
jgi:hypothetical protein